MRRTTVIATTLLATILICQPIDCGPKKRGTPGGAVAAAREGEQARANAPRDRTPVMPIALSGLLIHRRQRGHACGIR
jgi:hypothetical protein